MGTVILLLGVSSAGKTTYADALQKCLTTFEIVGFDHVAEKKLPKKYWPGGRLEKLGFFHVDTTEGPMLQFGEVGEKFLNNYQLYVSQLIESNKDIIIDDVLTAKQVKEFEASTSATIIKICLKPPIKIIKQREKVRGDRPIGSAVAMYHECYDELEYDICIDSSGDLSKNMDTIVKHIRMRQGVDILDCEMADFYSNISP